MNIMSLFGGMECGRIVMERAGVPVNKYYSSEVHGAAISVSSENYPCIIHLGDVEKWKEWRIDWSSIDLLIGGSPCQGFSRAGNELNFEDPRSKLFFVYADILNHLKSVNPKIKFMLENVKMQKEYINVISKYLNTEPVEINGKDGYLQVRPRLYWSNSDISGTYKGGYDNISDILDGSPSTIPVDSNKRIGGITENKRGYRPHRGDDRKTGISELGRILKPTAKYCDTITTTHAPKITTDKGRTYRPATIDECCKLSGIPVGYIKGLSDRQALKLIGNGWHVDIVVDVIKKIIQK